MAVEWTPFDHVGFGVGVNQFDVSVQRDRETDIPGVDFLGKIDIKYAGLMFYMKGFL